MRASYPASLSIEWARTEARERHSVALGGETSDDLLVTLREGDTHAAVIYYNDPSTEAAPPPSAVEMTLPVDLYDNRSTEDKPAPKPPQVTTWFELVVKLDESPVARIRPEDAALAQRLIAAAPRLVPGRTLGTFESVAAGLRASCGGLGSGTAYAVDVANPGTLALRVAAQFPVALEVRDRSGAALGCARAEIDRFETSLALELPAGSYVAIVDSAGLGPALFGSQVEAAPPGAGVRGGFALDVEVTP
jgi:hypothetical protein